MDYLIWGGVFISLLGLVGLIWCIVKVAIAKKSGLSDEDLRAVVQKVVPLNLGALMLSTLGLMLVILGIFFR